MPKSYRNCMFCVTPFRPQIIQDTKATLGKGEIEPRVVFISKSLGSSMSACTLWRTREKYGEFSICSPRSARQPESSWSCQKMTPEDFLKVERDEVRTYRWGLGEPHDETGRAQAWGKASWLCAGPDCTTIFGTQTRNKGIQVQDRHKPTPGQSHDIPKTCPVT